ncbi:MAG: GNAT family N-acetyltransferase [Candidatus Lokiarchaeota archaeon]|nr:GNAT family N-acetyltransferase [Candidatus Lokiarchaeota archaeon]
MLIKIELERIIIRNFTPNDWEGLSEIGLKYEASEYAKYDHGPWPESPEAYKGIVNSWSKGNDFLAVILKGNNKLIGFISLPKRGNAEFDFGFVFHPDFHGSGYATEGCKAVLKHIFEVFQADRINTGTARENVPSCDLLKRLGFNPVGENIISFRNDEDGNPIEFTGVYFTLLSEEWTKFQNPENE